MIAFVSGVLPKLNSSEKEDTKVTNNILQINDRSTGTREKKL